MASLKFFYPTGYFFSSSLLTRSFISKRGSRSLETQVTLFAETSSLGQLKLLVKEKDELFSVNILYNHGKYGVILLATELLCERKKKYNLIKELIRGQMSRIMKKKYEWQIQGLKISRRIRRSIHSGVMMASQLMTREDFTEEDWGKAFQLLEYLIEVGHSLLELFLNQSLAARQLQTEFFPVQLGFNVRNLQFIETIIQPQNPHLHSFCLNISWKDLEPKPGKFEWELLDRNYQEAQQHQWTIFLGPLFSRDFGSLPDWIVKKIQNNEEIEPDLKNFCQTIVQRYPMLERWILFEETATSEKKTRELWQQRGKEIACQFHELNPQSKTYIMVPHPFGGAFWKKSSVSPYEQGKLWSENEWIDGFFLKIHYGLEPWANYPRDAFEINTLLDRWGTFQKNLYLTFSIPSKDKNEEESNCSYWTPKIQQEMVRLLFLSFLIHRSVKGVFWAPLMDYPDLSQENFSEQEKKEILNMNYFDLKYPYSGLFQNNGVPKLSFYKIRALEQAYLE